MSNGVMGGYMIATRILTTWPALTAFRTRARGAALVAAVAGAASIGVKWLLAGVALLWGAAIVLFTAGK